MEFNQLEPLEIVLIHKENLTSIEPRFRTSSMLSYHSINAYENPNNPNDAVF